MRTNYRDLLGVGAFAVNEKRSVQDNLLPLGGSSHPEGPHKMGAPLQLSEVESFCFLNFLNVLDKVFHVLRRRTVVTDT